MPRLFRLVPALAVALALACLAAATPAAAGSYTVRECDYASGNGHHDFIWQSAGAPTVDLYAGSGCNEFGLAVRNSSPGTARIYPSGAYGGWFAYAPDGTVFTSFSGAFGVLESCCVSGMASYAEATAQTDGQGARAYLFQGQLGNDSWYPPSGVRGPVGRSWSSGTSGFEARRVGLQLRCGPGFSCSQGAAGDLRLRGRSFDFTLRDDAPPSIGEPSGSLVAGGWLRGTRALFFRADDVGGGLNAIEAAFDDGTLLQSPSSCAIVAGRYARLRPCPAGRSDTWTFDSARLQDGVRKIELRATDVGGTTTRRAYTVSVDNHAPATPRDVALTGGDGWRTANDFDLHWTNPGRQHAPIARVHWQACQVGGDLCVDGQRDGTGIASSGPIAVPAAGEWDVRLWLEDAAGNNDPETASPPQRLRYDPNRTRAAQGLASPGRKSPPAARRRARATMVVRASAERRHTRKRRWGRGFRRLAVAGGRPVLFQGRVSRPVPRHGKLVEVQAHFRGRWRTISAVRSRRGGRWRFGYTFRTTGRRATYRLRARVPVEAGYPFSAGASPPVRVTVLPS